MKPRRSWLPPSNPFVSIGPILALQGVTQVLTERRDRVVAVSPIVAGKALKGPADRLLVSSVMSRARSALRDTWRRYLGPS